MTLSEFINRKPPELRLGQWFYNCYLGKLRPVDRMQESTQELYHTRCEHKAFELIHQIMEDYQWKDLPDYD